MAGSYYALGTVGVILALLALGGIVDLLYRAAVVLRWPLGIGLTGFAAYIMIAC